MPLRSEAQRRLFYAAAGGKKTKAKGLSQAEAKKFIKDSGHQKNLEERVQKRLDKTFKKGKKRG